MISSPLFPLSSPTHKSVIMGITHHPHFPTTKKLITWALYALVPLALLHYYLFPHPSPSPHHHSQNPVHAISSSHQAAAAAAAGATRTDELGLNGRRARCDYAEGRWVREAAGPLYNGTSCGTIKDGQNCMAHGRPDTGYLHWRWKPTRCTLPRFNPVSFLRLLKGRHLAMIGDSMARNQLESLLCLLATASRPELVYRDGEENKFRRWVFREYNATVSVFWSPFLVRGVEKSAAAEGLNHNELHLDSADARWASELDKMDAVLFSVGHWFLHPAVYYEGNAVLGCHHCPELNHTEIGFFGVFRKAIRRALREVADAQLGGSGGEKEKLVVVTTFSPAHFEGEWDKAGACPKQEPFREGEKEMEYMDKEMRKIEAEEAAAAAAAKGGGRVKIEALDVTELALMRPDGHPGPYMYPHPFAEGPKERVQNDCVHWCLPGPIDAWNEILLDIIKKRWKQQLVGSPFG